MSCIVHRQSVHLCIGLTQRAAEDVNESCQQVRSFSHGFHYLLEWHGDGLCWLERHGSIQTAHLGHAQFSDDVPGFADIVDEFVAIGRNRSDPYKSTLQKEEISRRIPHVVDDLFLLERDCLSIPKDRVAKLSAKD